MKKKITDSFYDGPYERLITISIVTFGLWMIGCLTLISFAEEIPAWKAQLYNTQSAYDVAGSRPRDAYGYETGSPPRSSSYPKVRTEPAVHHKPLTRITNTHLFGQDYRNPSGLPLYR